MSTQYEHTPWLNPEVYEGSPATVEEKASIRFEYAFESKTEKNTKFKDNLSEYQQESVDI